MNIQDFDSWSTNLQTAIARNTNYLEFLPDVNSLLYEISENSSFDSLSNSHQNFLRNIFPPLVTTICQLNSIQNQYEDAIKEFLTASLLVASWAIQNQKKFFLNIVPTIVNPQNGISRIPQIFDETISFFIDAEIANSIFEDLKLYPEFESIKLSLQTLNYLLIYCQNKPGKLNLELETLMYSDIFFALDKFFSQLYSDQILRTFDDSSLDDLISKLLTAFYYYDENKFVEQMNLNPIFDFILFLSQSKVLKLQILGMRFFSNVFASKNLSKSLLNWPKLDSLFDFLVYTRNLHVEIIKRASCILSFIIKHKNISINIVDELYKRAILVHESDREQNFILIASVFLVFDEDQIFEFVSNKPTDAFLILFLHDALSYLNTLKDSLSEKLFKILFDKRNQVYESYSESIAVNQILIKFAQSMVSLNFRLFMINYCLSYLNEDFVIEFLVNLISHYPLIDEFCDDSILTVLIMSINQNRKGVFEVISVFHTKFKLEISEDEILQIIDNSIENVDDYFWEFLFCQLKNLGTKTFSESAYNYMLTMIKQEIPITEKFIEFLRYFILVINYKNRILLSDHFSVDSYNLVPNENFYFISLPVLGFDIIWHYYLKSNSPQVSKYLEESILLFGTQIRGMSVEQVFSSFFTFVGPAITFPFATIEMKTKALSILDKFIHVIEKDDDNYELGFLRHFQEDFDLLHENNLRLYELKGCGFDGIKMYFKTPIDQKIVNDIIKKYFVYDFSIVINGTEIIIHCDLDYPMNKIVIPKIPSLILSEQNFSTYLLLLLSTNKEIEDICWRLLMFMPTDEKAKNYVQNSVSSFLTKIKEKKCLRELLYYLQFFKLNDEFVSQNGIQALIDLYPDSNLLIRKEILRILFCLNENINTKYIKNHLKECILFLFTNFPENKSMKMTILHSLINQNEVHNYISEIVNENINCVLDFLKESNEFDDCLLLISFITEQFSLLATIIENIDSFARSNDCFYHIFRYLYDLNKDKYDFSALQNKSADFVLSSIRFLSNGCSNETVTKNSELFSIIQRQYVDVDLFSHFCRILEIVDYPNPKYNALTILEDAFKMPHVQLNSSLISLHMKLNKNKEIEGKCHDFLLSLFTNDDMYSISTIDFGVDFRGLKNSGTLCFANSILQQLYYITEFRQSIFINNGEPELQKVFAELTISSKNYVDATPFYKTFGEINIDMQQDAVEFMTLFMDRLRLEVKSIFRGEIENSLVRIDNKRPIPSSCSIEQFYVFPLSISESISNNNHIFEQKETISDYFSEESKEKFDVLKIAKLKTLPKVLILHLKRFEFDMNTFTRFKLNQSFQFPDVLTIDNTQFNLIGIVCHFGYADMGHYTSIVKNSSDSEFPWICFNDISVTKLKELPNDVNLSAYILFYSCINQTKENPIIKKSLVETVTNDNIQFLHSKHLFSTSVLDLMMINPHFDIQINYFFKIMKTKQVTSINFLNELAEKFPLDSNEDYFVSFIEQQFDDIKSIFTKNQDVLFSSMVYLALLVKGDKMYTFCSRLFELQMNFPISLFLDKVFSDDNSIILLKALDNNMIPTIYSLVNDNNTDSYNVEFILELLLRLDKFNQVVNDNQDDFIYSFESKLFPIKTAANILFSLTNSNHFLSFLVSVYPRVTMKLNDLLSFIKPTIENVRLLIDLIQKVDKLADYVNILDVLKKIKENEYIDDLLKLLKDETKYELISKAIMNQFNMILIFITNVNQEIREKGSEMLNLLDKNGENTEISKTLISNLTDAFSNSEYSRMMVGLNYIEDKLGQNQMENDKTLFAKLLKILKRNESKSKLSDDKLSILLSILFNFDDSILSEFMVELESYLEPSS